MNRCPLSLLSVLLCLAAGAHAARPLQTEEAEPVPAGRCELDAEAASLRADGVTERGQAFDVACGLGESTQANVGYAQARLPEGRVRAAALGFKTLLWKAEGDDAAALALAGALAWVRAPGSGWAQEATELKLAGTLPAAGSLWHANLGHLRETGGRASTVWGAAWELEPISAGPLAWAPMAECFGDDRRDAWFNAGLRVSAVPERLWLDVAWQRQVSGGKARGVSAGLKLAF